MICKACRDGGKLNLGGFTELANAMHLMCAAPKTCPCHHRTGKGNINDPERPQPK